MTATFTIQESVLRALLDSLKSSFYRSSEGLVNIDLTVCICWFEPAKYLAAERKERNVKHVDKKYRKTNDEK